MQRLLAATAFVLAFHSPLACAENGPVVQQGGGAQNGGDDILVELLNQLKNTNNLKPTAEGLGLVDARRARLCDICGQPLYKHADPGFECLPRDKDTGEVKKLAKIETQKAICPVCNHSFIGALHSKVINDKGGVDRDFCIHSIGKYTVHSKVWMCPDCGYAGLIEKWGANVDGSPISAATKAFVQENILPASRKRMIEIAGLNAKSEAEIPAELSQFSRYVLQTEIPDWLKYDHALQIYETMKLPHSLMATLYLDAAHACRREICSEVAVPGLHNSLQVSLGQSIRRVNHFLQTECLTLRRLRGDPVTDPTKPELDQHIVIQAAQNIIKIGEDIGRNPASSQQAGAGARAEDSYLRTGDMYILHIRLAGSYDRVGRLNDAAKVLEKARTFIPERLHVNLNNVENKDLSDYFAHQLALLRGVITDRLDCLRRERDYLFKAGRSNLAAIKFKEVPLKSEPLKPASNDAFDPAIDAYLLGELLRRGDSPAESAYLFGVADRIVVSYLDRVKTATARLGDDIRDANKEEFHAVDDQQQRWSQLKEWNDEQRALVKTDAAPDEYVRHIGEMMLAAANLADTPQPAALQPAATPSEGSGPTNGGHGDPIQTADEPPSKNENPPATKAPAPSASRIKTRAELFAMYGAALKRYCAEKKENPPTLGDLVKAGYVDAADSCLDANGKLWCPETKEKLLYQSRWKPGDKDAPVIFPIKGGTPTLFANGDVHVGLVR